MNIVSFGGGTNSTAMLIGMHERGEVCDLILFADTGGEKPHTYTHVAEFSQWLRAHGMPEIVTVKAPNETLEQTVVRLHSLPSVAYGFKTCSQRFKARPQEKYLHGMGIKDYTKLIGFDADEPHRAKPWPGNRYPLIEWNWGREECIAAIDRAGVNRPGKSACFFCPSSKKHEILQLGREYPILLKRALDMEANAELTAVKGLGRSFAWADVVKADAMQAKIPECAIELDCGCYDG